MYGCGLVVSRRRMWLVGVGGIYYLWYAGGECVLVGVVVKRYNYNRFPHIIYTYSYFSCIYLLFLLQHPYFLFIF